MIITKESKEKFIFTTKVEFNVQGEKELQYVILRELTLAEQNEVMKGGKISGEGAITDFVGMLDATAKMFPKCVIESSFTKEDGTPEDGKVISDFLKESSVLFQDILTTWIADKRIDLTVKKEGGNPLA